MDADELQRFEQVLEAIDTRATVEPRLERYRVAAEGVNGLEGVPDGWFVSRAMERLACNGGWWPGHFTYPVDETSQVVDIVTSGSSLRRGVEPTVRWAGVGSVWERDHFYTPMLRTQVATAPLLGFSSQALWMSMVFPNESAMLESFTLTYDVLGIAEDGTAEVDPFFVEWVTEAPGLPPELDPHFATRRELHDRLVAASTTWSTTHPCWNQRAMPRLDDEIWPDELVAQLLGLDVGRLH